MRRKQVTQLEIKECNWYATRALERNFFIPSPSEDRPELSAFNPLWERGHRLPHYKLIYGSWVRAMCEWRCDIRPIEASPEGWKPNDEWEREHFLKMYQRGGDVMLGGGDEEAGRKIRLTRIEADPEIARRLKKIDENRGRGKPPMNDADKEGMATADLIELILSWWLSLSLWAMRDESALEAVLFVRNRERDEVETPQLPRLAGWTKCRESLGLWTYREIFDTVRIIEKRRLTSVPLIEFEAGKLTPAPHSKAGMFYLGE